MEDPSQSLVDPSSAVRTVPALRRQGKADLDGVDIPTYLEREFRTEPTVLNLGLSNDRLHVVKVAMPLPDFFVRRDHRDYVLAPGYLEYRFP